MCSVARPWLALLDTVDCSPPDSSVRGILQSRTLEWFARSSSRGSSQPRDQTCVYSVSCTAGVFFTSEPPEKPFSEVSGPRCRLCGSSTLTVLQALGFESQLCSRMAGEGTDAFFFFFLRQTVVGGGLPKSQTKSAPPLPPPVPLTNQSAIKDARPIHIP